MRKRSIHEGERSWLEKELESIIGEIAELGRQIGEQLKYLSTHGALDEFVSLSNHRLGDARPRATLPG